MTREVEDVGRKQSGFMLPDPNETLLEARGQDVIGKSRVLLSTTYRRIKQDIIGGVHPPGAPLRIRRLHQQYGVGASTLREVLSRLAGTGFVEAGGGRGFRVAPISFEDLQDVCNLRRLLESLAVEQSVKNGGDRWEADLVAAYHGLSKIEKHLSADVSNETAEEWEARNRNFHEVLVSACPSERLLRFRRMLYDESARYRRLSLKTALSIRDIHAEHQAIFDAALKRDARLACRLTEQHIDRTVEVILATARQHFETTVKGNRKIAARGEPKP